MAKTIKFNLILDDYPVRNLEGLQKHFSIEDMLKYFRNGLLLRWLEVREYKKQYDAVVKIKEDESNKDIIKNLIEIFDMEIEENQIEKSIKILDYIEDEKKKNTIYREDRYEKKKIIGDYHSGYSGVIDHMVENKDNMALLKADAIEIEKEYLGLFELDFKDLYYRLADKAPKAVLAMLTRDVFRNKWLGENVPASITDNMRTHILPTSKIKSILGDDLKIVKRDTQAMWDPIERPEVEVMVLQIAVGTFVKNAGAFSEKLSYLDINDKCVKLKGLEYQCNNAGYELLYMEV